MYRVILATAIALLLLNLPTHSLAQEPAERVLVDATLWINPPSSPSMCFMLEAGRLTIATKIITPAIERRPVILAMNGLMEDPGTNISIRVEQDETATTKQVKGGRYCWNVEVDAPETPGMSNAQRGSFTTQVATRMTLATP